ncbi:MAG: ACT domain-containing protein [Ilumatobacter sp.]|uniref:ACT domain-containing protein n=1 Tax=Ilumatobacter sp. TaxID=1967498 RepID=UPI00260A1C48|nr:ACT domain-containing protein [Ilumatobacter sp.]MDJ0769557.1 ACT domain-containing protein [Ilumatobacter sp.]
MAGETDLDRMLASLAVERRPGTFTFVTGPWKTLKSVAHAEIREAEGETLVVTIDDARAAGAPVEFEAAWLTLTVHSSLEAVGLTAAVSRALADEGIACNVLAGYHHDHLLVPVESAASAITAIETLTANPSRVVSDTSRDRG